MYSQTYLFITLWLLHSRLIQPENEIINHIVSFRKVVKYVLPMQLHSWHSKNQV